MFTRFVFFTMVLSVSASAFAQTQPPWPCRDEIRKADPDTLFIRVSDRVTNAMSDKKVLPDVSDIKGKGVDSLVVVHIIISPQGDVRCSQIQEGDANLQQRSLDAAQQWHCKPINVDTWIRLSYRNNDVEVVVPPR